MKADILDQLKRPGALRIEFQPIVSLYGGGIELYALEALARGPKGTNLESAELMFEYARRKGSEMQIDLICIAHALAAAATLPGKPVISINVHGSTLCGIRGFAQRLIASAEAFGIEPGQIMLEIVEHRGRWKMGELRNSLMELRRAGVRIAVDDLGSGASNYRMVIDCAPDHLKIDRYVVAGCASDPIRVSVLRSIVALARECDAVPIAEGIENAEDLDVVRDLGIDKVQGWLYSRSMPPRETAESAFLAHSEFRKQTKDQN